MLYFSFL